MKNKVIRRWQVKERFSEDILEQLLFLAGCQTADQQEKFLNPPNPKTFLDNLDEIGLSKAVVERSRNLILKAIEDKRPIIVHGDYDVDGLCATAILWRTIYQDLSYKNCLPFIPNRFEHGYGLTRESVDGVLEVISNQLARPRLADSQGVALLITVDCGITALEGVDYAQEKGLEVLIVDHHSQPEKVPSCQILWTDKLCATGLAWVLSSELLNRLPESELRPQGTALRYQESYLDLVALATIADLQPLTGPNRSLVKFGLEVLNKTGNVGLKQLIKSSGIEGREIGTFEVGWLLAPRLNAAGRLEDALASLRLLCTNDTDQAGELAQKLNQINSERQELTYSMVELALEKLKVENGEWKVKVVVDEEFHEGIIGLVAGKLAQEFGAPAVVISKGPEFSKASARSIAGFNIVEFLRSLGDHFENVGGHAGAAGFTIRTEKIGDFLSAVKGQMSNVVLPEPVLKIDAEIKFEDLNFETYEKISRLAPFGLGNPEPIFLLKNAQVAEARTVGSQNQHLKLRVVRVKRSASSAENEEPSSLNANRSTLNASSIDCIGFDLGGRVAEVQVGQEVDLVFYLSEDKFNGNGKVSLKIKDFKQSDV